MESPTAAVPARGGGEAPRVDVGRQRPVHGFLRPVVAVVGGYVLAALLWLTVGERLPGGRWFAVHLFTLGILTNLVVALTHHFAETLLHALPARSRTARFLLLNAGVVVTVAFSPGRGWPFAAGAALVTAAVTWLHVDLRRMRRRSLTRRFAFVVRAYERACGTFVHGALLGMLLGIGVVGGGWYSAARLAHLHVNALGWGGLTLLATVVFFGPTVMRTRMEPGADEAAAAAIRRGTAALTLAVPSLLLTGAGGSWSLAARLAAALALAGYAGAATAVCVPVMRAGARAKDSAQARMIRAACGWFVVVVWVDAAVVAGGRLRLLDGLGALLIVAVLGQAILASLGYLAPMLAPGGPPARKAVRGRLERAPRARPLLLNVGAAGIGATALAGPGAGIAGAAVARGGWLLVTVAVLGQFALIAWGLLGTAPHAPAAASASRHPG